MKVQPLSGRFECKYNFLYFFGYNFLYLFLENIVFDMIICVYMISFLLFDPYLGFQFIRNSITTWDYTFLLSLVTYSLSVYYMVIENLF